MSCRCWEESNQGNITYKYCYFSEMDEEDLQDHCETNKYLFDKYGNCVFIIWKQQGGQMKDIEGLYFADGVAVERDLQNE